MSRAHSDTQAEISTRLAASFDDEDRTIFDPHRPWDDDHTTPHSSAELDELITAAKTEAPVYQAPSTGPLEVPAGPKGVRRFLVASAGLFVLLLGGAAALIHSSRHASGPRPTLPPELTFTSPPPPSLPQSSEPASATSQPGKGPTILHAVIDRTGFSPTSIPDEAPTVTESLPSRRIGRHKHRHRGARFEVDANGAPILP